MFCSSVHGDAGALHAADASSQTEKALLHLVSSEVAAVAVNCGISLLKCKEKNIQLDK